MNPLFHDIPFSPEAQAYLQEIEKNLKSDLAAPATQHYSHETFTKVSEAGLAKLHTRLQSLAGTAVELSVLRQEWQAVVTDYYQENRWGFETQQAKPPKILTEDDKLRKEMWPYIWAVIQSMIILKTIVYYFGIQASDDPSTTNKVLLSLALATSAFTLIFFAWRKTRAEARKEKENGQD